MDLSDCLGSGSGVWCCWITGQLYFCLFDVCLSVLGCVGKQWWLTLSELIWEINSTIYIDTRKNSPVAALEIRYQTQIKYLQVLKCLKLSLHMFMLSDPLAFPCFGFSSTGC